MSSQVKVPPSRLNESDVLLYRGKSTMAKLIRLFDGAEVSHAGLFRTDFTVAEALGRGIERRPIQESAQNNEWLLASRLAVYPVRMTPVAAVADRYLARPNRYGYEQILLLALLAATRRLPMTPLLAPLLRKVFDAAATFVANLTRRGREPLICSEFVFRCYHEAVAGEDDGYELRIAGASAAVQQRGRAAARRRVAAGARIDRGSLLDQLLQFEERDRAASATLARPRVLTDRRGIDAQGEAYLRSTRMRGERAFEGDPLPIESVDSELLRFASAVARSQRRIRTKLLRRSASARSVSRAQAVRALAVAADFVTPGDLLESPSLVPLGRIDLGARLGQR